MLGKVWKMYWGMQPALEETLGVDQVTHLAGFLHVCVESRYQSTCLSAQWRQGEWLLSGALGFGILFYLNIC